MVHFVGAGPGAEDLITIRGQRILEQADVIIYAGSLVNPGLLKAAKDGCRIYNSAYMNLEEIIGVMEEAERLGYMTVRLHTGDPSIYGAVREQMEELGKRGIPYDMCPGVSSLFGAASALKLEYTMPEVSQSIIITRAGGRTAVPERERLKQLAVHQATMILFLSSGMSKKVRDELLAGGYPPDTPAAVVYKATWPEEKIIVTTLWELSYEMKKAKITQTALMIVGRVLGSDTPGPDYARSRLYDAAFTTEYRKGAGRPAE